ncbi:MAG: hypothetical protein QGH73_19470 [Rhodospirillales bacterium]|jgi:hypothetical protein|nr:hypothetical protein [Rhodospirillales bacterium]|tara:strand:- start:11 stop:520 length:510 start_codon:yes stop_codon:yes gene_type:complete
MADEPVHYSYSVEFNMQLGFFYNAWAVTDASLDFTLGKFLRLSHKEAHILTAGMFYGSKTTLLRNLLHQQAEDKQKTELLRTLKIIQNDSLRNEFAHAYIASDEKTVSFISRSRGGDYKCKEREFTRDEFIKHIDLFIAASKDFYNALEADELEFAQFQHAALSASSKE